MWAQWDLLIIDLLGIFNRLLLCEALCLRPLGRGLQQASYSARLAQINLLLLCEALLICEECARMPLATYRLSPLRLGGSGLRSGKQVRLGCSSSGQLHQILRVRAAAR